MRTSVRTRLGFAILGLTSALALGGILVDGVGCSVPEPTAVFLGVSSDMRVAEDFDSVGLFVSANGVVKYSQVFRVNPNGQVFLPASLSILQPDDPTTPVHIRVAGYKDGAVLAVRDAITTIPSNQISALRLPLQWLSTGTTKGRAAGAIGAAATATHVSLGGVGPRSSPLASDTSFSEFAQFFTGLELPCPAGQTLIGGTCASAQLDPQALVPAKPENGEHVALVYGGASGLRDGKVADGDGTCFPVATCFEGAKALRAEDLLVVRDPDGKARSCMVQRITAAPTTELNFALDRDGTPGAYIALDRETLVDAKAGGWIDQGSGPLLLPLAVCERLGKGVRAILVSTSCPAKRVQDPTCGPWSAVKSALRPGFPQGRYGGAVDGGAVDGSAVDAKADRTDAPCTDCDGGPQAWPQAVTLMLPTKLTQPVRMAFDSAKGDLWIKGRQGSVKVSAIDTAPAVVPIDDTAACNFGFVGAHNGAAALGCYGGVLDDAGIPSPSGYARVETDGAVIAFDAGNGTIVGGATVMHDPGPAPVIGTSVGPDSFLKFLVPGGPNVVQLVGDAGYVAGITDLFYVPASGAAGGEATFYFTGGTRVYAARTFGGMLTSSAFVKVAAQPPPPLYNSYKTTALFVQPTLRGDAVFYYGLDQDFSRDGVILRQVDPTGTSEALAAFTTQLATASSAYDKPALVGDDKGIYWSDGANVFGLAADAVPGTRPTPLSATPAGEHVLGLAVTPAYVYWIEEASRRLMRTPKR